LSIVKIAIWLLVTLVAAAVVPHGPATNAVCCFNSVLTGVECSKIYHVHDAKKFYYFSPQHLTKRELLSDAFDLIVFDLIVFDLVNSFPRLHTFRSRFKVFSPTGVCASEA
jgi:hypothetical protein